MEPSTPTASPAPVPTHDFKTIRRRRAALPVSHGDRASGSASSRTLPAFVINLPRAAERLTGFQSSMAEHDWDVTVFPAIDRRDLAVIESSPTHKLVQHRDSSAIQLQMVPNHAGYLSLSLGQVACTLSHIALWEKIVAEDLPHACIFEDDAQIISPWWGRLWPATADFVFISDRVMGVVPGHINSTDKLDSLLAHHPYLPLAPGCGTEAYIVTNSGARKALHLMKEAYMPVDLQLLCCAHGARLIHHSLVEHKRPSMPELETWTTSHYHTVHRNDWPSFVNER